MIIEMHKQMIIEMYATKMSRRSEWGIRHNEISDWLDNNATSRSGGPADDAGVSHVIYELDPESSVMFMILFPDFRNYTA